jgi:hypothetical protein
MRFGNVGVFFNILRCQMSTWPDNRHNRHHRPVVRAYPQPYSVWLGHSEAVPQMAENWAFASLQTQPPNDGQLVLG